MLNFVYHSHTKIIFGHGVENGVGEECKAHGAKKLLVAHGVKSAEESGLLGRVLESLKAAGLEYVVKGGVQPNPRIGLVNECIKLCKEENVDFLLAVGGGSVIDTCKGVALALASGLDDAWPIYTGDYVATDIYPVGVVLTQPASGSEASWTTVITNPEGGLKRSFTRDFVRPKFAMLDPELCATLPKFQKACGVVDTLMHTMDRYFAAIHEDTEITDAIGEALMRTTIKYADAYMDEADNYDAASQIMWAASISHNNLTGCGKGFGDWACHQIEHEISGMYEQVAHGAGLTAIWGSWARYASQDDYSKMARFARNVWGIKDSDDKTAALSGIERTEEFFRHLGMPTSIPELGLGILPEETITELANKAVFYGKRTTGNYRVLDANGVADVLRAANK